MQRTIRLAALLLVPALAAATAFRELRPYVRDEPHSQINFLASSRLIDAQGFWEKWNANIMFDADALEKSSVNIDIDAKTINTRVTMRDNDLRSKNFFYTDSFPTITFASKIVNVPAGQPRDSLLSNTRMTITGDLTIRGITKIITVPSTLVFFDRKANRGRVKGKFTVMRKDYNVGFDPPMNPVQNEVEVNFDISFVGKK
jgi:polyisoprenoid-binding protein YceI